MRRFWKLSRQDRLMFYQLLGVQIESGFVPARACQELTSIEGLSAGIRELALAGSQAEREGRTVIAGMADTRLLPMADLAVLTIAEQHGQLAECLQQLASPQEQIPGVLTHVVGPNLYFALILGILAWMIASSQGFFDRMNLSGEGNPLYETSLLFQDWAVPVLGLFVIVSLAIIWVVKRWVGPLRQLFQPFENIESLRFGILFCQIGAMMSRNGAVGRVILEHVADIYRRHRFLHHHSVQAHRRIVTDGMSLEDALSDGLLGERYCGMLRGLVPGGAADRYEAGYRALAILQRQVLGHRLGTLNRILKLFLLMIILMMFMQIIDGIYSMYDSIARYE